MHSCSCDICAFSSPHDYRPRRYYCKNGEFFNDQELRYNCSAGKICDRAYKEKYGVSYVMDLFEETAAEIKKLRDRESQLKAYFTQSDNSLLPILSRVLEAELKGKKQICVVLDDCPAVFVDKLKAYGFEVEEGLDDFDELTGYSISWK